MKVAVVGAGAAGYFAAISAKEHHPNADVWLIEKSNKVLSKVKVSGGGRCNVTHACFNNRQFSQNYPRGERFLRKAFDQFDVNDTICWYKQRGVAINTESDGRMFPETNSSATIIKALQSAANDSNVQLLIQHQITQIRRQSEQWELTDLTGQTLLFDKVIIASGGSPTRKGLKWLIELGEEIVDPVPSLFTFNFKDQAITELQGVSLTLAQVRIAGSKWVVSGPILITHWGISGPAVLRLSAFAARDIYDRGYEFEVLINWLGELNETTVREILMDEENSRCAKRLENHCPFNLPQRFWKYLIDRSNPNIEKRWIDLNRKELNRLVNTLCNDSYQVRGKTTFKEEFVTAGGVDLSGVNTHTLESKQNPGLYFAGEVLDIDGVTGGFNFQAAWTTGWIAGKLR